MSQITKYDGGDLRDGQYALTTEADRARAIAAVMTPRFKERLKGIMDAGTPENTKKAYASDMRYFWAWASAIGWTDTPTLPVPMEIVAKYITDHAEGLDDHVEEQMVAFGFKAKQGPHMVSTISRRISTLSKLHSVRSLPNPCQHPSIIALLSKARTASARRGVKPMKKKAAKSDVLDLMLATCDDSMAGVRDRAMLLFGWASGGRRRSEICEAVIENLHEMDDNFTYRVARSKTDQKGEGHEVPVMGKAADALRAWIAKAGIKKGPLFLQVTRYGSVVQGQVDGRTVSRVVKHRAEMAGLDPSKFGGHSLRSGFITEASLRGHGILDAMKLSNHKSVDVAMGYYQAGDALHNKTANMAG